MTLRTLIARNLVHFRRTNLAVAAGVAVAVAVLAGALMVGDSVRGSLRAIVLERLGRVDCTLVAEQPFREALAAGIAARPEFRRAFRAACPALVLRGVVVAERTGLRAHDVEVIGIDDRFWRLQGLPAAGPDGRDALVGTALARELGAVEGASLLLRVARQQGTPRESLFGRREDAGRTIRLECRNILGPAELGEFTLRPGQGEARTIFVPLGRLQRDLDAAGRANTVLLSGASDHDEASSLRALLRAAVALEDLGVRLRAAATAEALVVESSRILLDDTLAEAARAAGRSLGLDAARVYTYLANTIAAGGREIPYSVVSAVEPGPGFEFLDGPGPDALWLNDWAARELGAAPGAPVRLDYFAWLAEGRLASRSAAFRLAGIVPLAGGAADPALAPEVPGISEAENLSDWNPPFPIDLARIEARDEEYWHRYRTAPKAFVRLERGQELWATRFGRTTSVRLFSAAGRPVRPLLDQVAARLRDRLDPETAGIRLAAVKAEGLAAARGTTDFGAYFLYFSFFLIAAAVLLAGLFFRLGVEGRIRELGTLGAAGFPRATIRNIILVEAAIVAAAGALAGAAGSLGFAALLVAALGTSWHGAVGGARIVLYPSLPSIAAAAVAGIVLALAAAAWTLRGLRGNSPRGLLAGVLEPPAERARRAGTLRILVPAAAAAALALAAAALADRISDTAGFFGSGVLLLTALLAETARRLRGGRTRLVSTNRAALVLRFGLRNAAHRPGRSLLCAALIAAATFIIVSVEAFRHDPRQVGVDPAGGTGGFALLAQAAVPLVGDLNTREGLEAAGLAPEEIAALAGARFDAFRVRAGDDASCLNLFSPREPRILGARRSFLERGRFSFRDSLAESPSERANPWLLLERVLPDGAVPAAADGNTLQYVLHRKLGDEITVAGGTGAPVRLKLVAALRDSLFQGELVIAEEAFLRAFPGEQGYGFLLVEASPERREAVTRALEEGLADFGVDAGSTAERLAAYHQVENTYLSTFQALGGLGLILGTLGVGTVLLRNVLERQAELALLRAVGYSRASLAATVVAENLILIGIGLGAGTACALVAIAPAVRARGVPVAVASLALLLGVVLVAGLAASTVAVVAAFRRPVLDALRSE